MPSARVRDLISAANVRFIFAEPWQRPCESNSRAEIIPVVREDGFSGLRSLRADEFEVGNKIQVDGIIRTHPAIEAPPGDTE